MACNSTFLRVTETPSKKKSANGPFEVILGSRNAHYRSAPGIAMVVCIRRMVGARVAPAPPCAPLPAICRLLGQPTDAVCQHMWATGHRRGNSSANELH